MKLYCFGESGNAYKAALTMELSNVKWEPMFVDFFKGEARSEAGRGRPDLQGLVRRRDGPDADRGDGRAPPRDHRRPPQARVQGRGQRR